MEPQWEIAACRTVDWDAMETRPGVPPTPIYPGSIVTPCEACGNDCYVGPRQQEVMAVKPTITVMCFRCANVLSKSNAIDVTVAVLGNPHGARNATH